MSVAKVQKVKNSNNPKMKNWKTNTWKVCAGTKLVLASVHFVDELR
jgi:hypothetical protein